MVPEMRKQQKEQYQQKLEKLNRWRKKLTELSIAEGGCWMKIEDKLDTSWKKVKEGKTQMRERESVCENESTGGMNGRHNRERSAEEQKPH